MWCFELVNDPFSLNVRPHNRDTTCGLKTPSNAKSHWIREKKVKISTETEKVSSFFSLRHRFGAVSRKPEPCCLILSCGLSFPLSITPSARIESRREWERNAHRKNEKAQRARDRMTKREGVENRVHHCVPVPVVTTNNMQHSQRAPQARASCHFLRAVSVYHRVKGSSTHTLCSICSPPGQTWFILSSRATLSLAYSFVFEDENMFNAAARWSIKQAVIGLDCCSRSVSSKVVYLTGWRNTLGQSRVHIVIHGSLL